MPKLLPLILVSGLPQAGKTTFARKLKRCVNFPLMSFNEEDYVRQAGDPTREYCLNYADYAENLLFQAMAKDVEQATYEDRAVIVESNLFVLPEIRQQFRSLVMTSDHIPYYVSIFIGEERRARNKPLDKYTMTVNQRLISGNRRPKLGEGFITLSAREVLEEFNVN